MLRNTTQALENNAINIIRVATLLSEITYFVRTQIGIAITSLITDLHNIYNSDNKTADECNAYVRYCT